MRSRENELKNNISDPKNENLIKINSFEEKDTRLFGKDLKNINLPFKQNELAKANVKSNLF